MSPDPRHLLVPIAVEALVVTPTQPDFANEADLISRYDLMQFGVFLGEKITPPPFQTTAGFMPGKRDRDRAVRLHWALPDGLTKGIHKEGGLDLPHVPNRWLVLRYTPKKEKDYVKTWIIESDRLFNPLITTERAIAENNIPWPTLETKNILNGTLAEDVKTPYMHLGHITDGKGWKETPSRRLARLTAAGPGDPAFAACYATCKNVFAMEDPLNDIPADQLDAIGKLTYVVIGWYSPDKLAQDPIAQLGQFFNSDDAEKQIKEKLDFAKKNGETWAEKDEPAKKEAMRHELLAEKLAALGWQTDGDAAPAGLVCHGAVYRVDISQKKSGVPQGPVTLAAGNTSVEALAALLEPELRADGGTAENNEEYGRHETRLLEAFQYHLLDTLDEPDGPWALKYDLHRHGFGSQFSGYTWEIRKTPLPGQNDNDTRPQFPADPAILSQYSALSEIRTTLNRLGLVISDLQWELYSGWYKHTLQRLAPLDTPERQEELKKYTASIKDTILLPLMTRLEPLLRTYDTLAKDEEQKQDDLKKRLSTINYDLHQLPAPQFWRANDPVIMISGIERSFKHGADGRFSAEGRLFCRWSGQVITEWTAGTGSAAKKWTPAMSLLPVQQLPDAPAWQSLFKDLWAEAMGLDPERQTAITASSTIAADAVQLFQSIPFVVTGQTNVTPATMAAAGGLGTGARYPSRLALSYWEQPWTPMFLDWEVDYIPSKISDWQFNPTLGDYVPKETMSPDPSNAATYTGRIPLSSHAVDTMETQLKRYLDAHPDEKEYIHLAAIKDKIGQFNILSQALGGFHDALLMRRSMLDFPVLDPYDPDLMLKVAKFAGRHAGFSPQPEFAFHPLRAGQLKLLRLRIVDAFGQVKDIDVTKQPLRISERLSGKTKDTLYLPPRLSQAGRLTFRWISAADTSGSRQEANATPDSNPVIGWVLPNHLDNSLLVYDAVGDLHGFAYTDPEKNVKYKTLTSRPDTEINPHLLNVIDIFRKPTLELMTAATFDKFMKHIDETLHTVEPLGSRKDTNLSILMGRPLALVRALLKLEPDGLPAWPQDMTALNDLENFLKNNLPKDSNDWQAAVQAFQHRPQPELAKPFPIWLGERAILKDGLIGFFKEDDYSCFYTACDFESPKGPTLNIDGNDTGFISHDSAVRLSFTEKPDSTLVTQVTLTMLVDPRTGVHATSGILPAKYIELPAIHYQQALARLMVAFRAGPVLSPDGITLPLPVLPESREWHWLDQWNENPLPVRDSTDRATLSDNPPQIHDGWLRLNQRPVPEK